MNRNTPEDLVNDLIHQGKSLACDEDGFVTLTDKDGNSYVAQTNKIESFQILAGYLDGVVVDKATVEKLADIPSKEVLIAKFLGSIRSPLYSFAYAIQAIVDKDGAPAEEAAPAEAAE